MAKSEYNSAYSALKANDNSDSTRWATASVSDSNINPQWWGIDLGVGNSAAVRSVKIAGYYDATNGELYARSYALQFSDDGTNWTTKSTFNTAEAALTVQSFQNL
jgi:hypothetical protein